MELTAKLRADLDAAYRFYTLRAYVNYGVTYLSFGTALMTTGLATIAVAIDLFPRAVLAILTAAPGILVVAVQSFRLHAKYKWHQRHAWDIKGLQQRLDYENVPVARVSRELRQLRARYAKTYPTMKLTLQVSKSHEPRPKA